MLYIDLLAAFILTTFRHWIQQLEKELSAFLRSFYTWPRKMHIFIPFGKKKKIMFCCLSPSIPIKQLCGECVLCLSLVRETNLGTNKWVPGWYLMLIHWRQDGSLYRGIFPLYLGVFLLNQTLLYYFVCLLGFQMAFFNIQNTWNHWKAISVESLWISYKYLASTPAF